MVLQIRDFPVECIIGDLPDERVVPQKLLVDASLEIDGAADETDSLGDTVDYAALCEAVSAALAAAKCRMLERAARIVLDVCEKTPRVKSASVSVRKTGRLPGGGSAAVSLSSAKPDDFELCGIETIARGVCIVGGKILLCKAKGGKTSYLPGGHVEFGETGREALVREMKEETGLAASAGAFLGVVENSFVQKGAPHSEINLVYEMRLADCANGVAPDVEAKEDWIEFEWRDLSRLDDLLPADFRVLAVNPSAHFG